MTKDVDTVTPRQKLIHVKRIYEKLDFHRHIPVVDNYLLTGMISLIDFMRFIGDASLDDNDPIYQNQIVEEVMTSNPVSISPDTSIQEAARIFSAGTFHSLPVTDDDNMLGILTSSDVLKYIS